MKPLSKVGSSDSYNTANRSHDYEPSIRVICTQAVTTTVLVCHPSEDLPLPSLTATVTPADSDSPQLLLSSSQLTDSGYCSSLVDPTATREACSKPFPERLLAGLITKVKRKFERASDRGWRSTSRIPDTSSQTNPHQWVVLDDFLTSTTRRLDEDEVTTSSDFETQAVPANCSSLHVPEPSKLYQQSTDVSKHSSSHATEGFAGKALATQSPATTAPTLQIEPTASSFCQSTEPSVGVGSQFLSASNNATEHWLSETGRATPVTSPAWVFQPDENCYGYGCADQSANLHDDGRLQQHKALKERLSDDSARRVLQLSIGNKPHCVTNKTDRTPDSSNSSSTSSQFSQNRDLSTVQLKGRPPLKLLIALEQDIQNRGNEDGVESSSVPFTHTPSGSSGSGSGSGSRSGAGPSTNPWSLDNLQGTNRRPSQKRRRAQRDQDDDEDDFQGGANNNPTIRITGPAEDPRARELSCHYNKYNPQKFCSTTDPSSPYNTCGKGFRDTAKIMQHFKEVHYYGNDYCYKCLVKFKNEKKLVDHYRNTTCNQMSDEQIEEEKYLSAGTDRRERMHATKKKARDVSVEARWGQIWEALFPEYLCPSSPFRTPGSTETAFWHRIEAVIARVVDEEVPVMPGSNVQTERERRKHLYRSQFDLYLRTNEHPFSELFSHSATNEDTIIRSILSQARHQSVVGNGFYHPNQVQLQQSPHSEVFQTENISSEAQTIWGQQSSGNAVNTEPGVMVSRFVSPQSNDQDFLLLSQTWLFPPSLSVPDPIHGYQICDPCAPLDGSSDDGSSIQHSEYSGDGFEYDWSSQNQPF